MKIVVRKGTADDHNWIAPLLRDGAREGHFSPSVRTQASALLNAIVTVGGLQMLKLRGGDQVLCFVTATLTVAEVDGVPASFVISLIDGQETEIHLAATSKAFQRKGCFGVLVQHEVSQCPPGSRVFARCYKKSKLAANALKKRGFKMTKDGNPQEFSL